MVGSLCDHVIQQSHYSSLILNVHITPRTADDADQQFVYVNVNMELSNEVCTLVQ